jgi:ParB family chromosome partitioning protein
MARSAAARKADAPPAAVRVHQYGHMVTTAFVIAKENPRTIRRPEDVEALAQNITAHGVLEPLVVYLEGGKCHVTVGGTRLLAAQKAGIPELPYTQLPKEAAIAAGLAEQEGHTPLHPADQARAYAAELDRLAGDGPIARDAAIRTIANRVGRTPRFVEQRLALAALHPPILKALREDKIGLGQNLLRHAALRIRHQAHSQRIVPRGQGQPRRAHRPSRKLRQGPVHHNLLKIGPRSPGQRAFQKQALLHRRRRADPTNRLSRHTRH